MGTEIKIGEKNILSSTNSAHYLKTSLLNNTHWTSEAKENLAHFIMNKTDDMGLLSKLCNKFSKSADIAIEEFRKNYNEVNLEKFFITKNLRNNINSIITDITSKEAEESYQQFFI